MIVRVCLASTLAAALALAWGAAPAAARNPPMPHVNPRGGSVDATRVGFDVHDKVHIKNKLRELRAEAIRLQEADGGKLSEAHRADLQARLAVIRDEACQAGLAGC